MVNTANDSKTSTCSSQFGSVSSVSMHLLKKQQVLKSYVSRKPQQSQAKAQSPQQHQQPDSRLDVQPLRKQRDMGGVTVKAKEMIQRNLVWKFSSVVVNIAPRKLTPTNLYKSFTSSSGSSSTMASSPRGSNQLPHVHGQSHSFHNKRTKKVKSSLSKLMRNQEQRHLQQAPKQVQQQQPQQHELELMLTKSQQLAQQVAQVLASEHNSFTITSEGCGGAYLLKSSDGQCVGIFKPRDEEFMAPNNPRGYVKENAQVGVTDHPVQKGFLIGNGALREQAVFLLDQAYDGFSCVPETCLMHASVHGSEPKEGSMQRFVKSECSAEDMGTMKFAIPEVQKIGILDCRIFNTDRHAGNILLNRKDQEQWYEMTPIDHGFCMPSYKNLDGACFDWLSWPQAEFPFSNEALDHIARLDAAKDAAICRQLGIEEDCVATLQICTRLLQFGAAQGYSLYEIGSKMQRDGDGMTASPLEDLIAAVSTRLGQVEGREGLDQLVEQVAEGFATLFVDQPKRKVRSISCFS